MSHESAPLAPDERPLARFAPVHYQADGEFSLPAALQLVGVLGMAGMALGAVASFLSQYFYLVILFPMAIGLGVGFVGSWCIRRFRIRHPALCGLAGFVAGGLAMIMMHYGGYRTFEKEREDLAPVQLTLAREAEIRADWDNAEEFERELLEFFDESPGDRQQIERVLKVNSFPAYMEFQAEQGVELSHRGNRGLNLGYTGSYIYWAVEGLIVAGIAFFIMKNAAAAPFCSTCGQWKTGVELGRFHPPSRVLQVIEHGELTPLYNPEIPPAQLNTAVSAFCCPQCGEESPVVVRVESITLNREGNENRKQLLQMTYPGAALSSLAAICQPPAPDAEPDAVAE